MSLNSISSKTGGVDPAVSISSIQTKVAYTQNSASSLSSSAPSCFSTMYENLKDIASSLWDWITSWFVSKPAQVVPIQTPIGVGRVEPSAAGVDLADPLDDIDWDEAYVAPPKVQAQVQVQNAPVAAPVQTQTLPPAQAPQSVPQTPVIIEHDDYDGHDSIFNRQY